MIDDEWLLKNVTKLKDGEPCSHRGCLSHVTHPCEGCGRIGGRKVSKHSLTTVEGKK